MRPLQRQSLLAILMLAAAYKAGAIPPQAPQPKVAPRAPTASAGTILAGDFKIAGMAVNSVTGEPLASARITLTNTRDGRQSRYIITGESGHFEFPALPAGKYSLFGAKRGFVAGFYQQHEQYSTAIVTGAEFETQSLVLRLVPLASISGKVFDEAGNPVRSATVQLFRRTTDAGVTRVVGGGTDFTDDQGYYEFPSISPGEYFVAASGRPWYAVHSTTFKGEGQPRANIPQSLDVVYPTTFASGSTDSDGAAPTEIKGGDQVRMDVHLSPVPSLHLVYNVPESQQGFSAPSFQQRVFGRMEFEQQIESRCLGSACEVSGVPAGHYTMMQWRDGKQHSSEVNLGRDGEELDFSHLESTSEVTLHVNLPHEDSANGQVVLALQNKANSQVVASSVLDSSRIAKLQAVPAGQYAVLVGGTDRPYAVSRVITVGKETAGHDLEVPANGSLDATVQLSVGVASVEGVVKRNGKPASGVMVALIPKDPESHRELFRRDQSDLDGTFVLRGIIPGTYTLIAVDDAWGFAWLEPGILSRYFAKGQNIKIGELMRGSVLLPDPVQVQPR